MLKVKEIVRNLEVEEVYELVLNGSISRFPAGFWEGEHAKEKGIRCVNYLLRNKLEWTDEDIRDKFCKKVLIQHKLSGMLKICFDNSPTKCILTIMKDKFYPWEYCAVSPNYWNRETGRNAVKIAIEEKLGWDIEDIKNNISSKVFKELGLSAMLQCVYGGSPYRAICDVYPNKLKAWELKNVPIGFWDECTAREAIKWLIEDKLNLSLNEDKYLGLQKEFIKHGLGYLLSDKFENSPYLAMDFAYPNRFKPSNFKTFKDYENYDLNKLCS